MSNMVLFIVYISSGYIRRYDVQYIYFTEAYKASVYSIIDVRVYGGPYKIYKAYYRKSPTISYAQENSISK